MITLYHQTILNSRSLIQLSETLLVKLTETHIKKINLFITRCFYFLPLTLSMCQKIYRFEWFTSNIQSINKMIKNY